MGVDIGKTEFVIYAQNLAGRKYVFTNSGRVSNEKKVCNVTFSNCRCQPFNWFITEKEVVIINLSFSNKTFIMELVI